jgi:hypothetical protein
VVKIPVCFQIRVFRVIRGYPPPVSAFRSSPQKKLDRVAKLKGN